NRVPLLDRLEFHMGEQIARMGIEKDGIAAHPVSAQNFFQLRPDRVVPPFILGVLLPVHPHAKCFPDHAGPQLSGVASTSSFSTTSCRIKSSALPGYFILKSKRLIEN